MKNKDKKQSCVVIVIIALVLMGILLITGSMAEDLSFRFYQHDIRLTDEGLIESPELQTTFPLSMNDNRSVKRDAHMETYPLSDNCTASGCFTN